MNHFLFCGLRPLKSYKNQSTEKKQKPKTHTKPRQEEKKRYKQRETWQNPLFESPCGSAEDFRVAHLFPVYLSVVCILARSPPFRAHNFRS